MRRRWLGLGALRAMVSACDTSLRGVRDRAIILLGFAGALRRSELTQLRVLDVSFVASGMVLSVGEHFVGVPYAADQSLCPVLALRAWLARSRLKAGALFRAIGAAGRVRPSPRPGRDGAKLIARVVKSAARRAGIDPATASPQALRAGLAVEAHRAGTGRAVIAQHGRWSPRSVQRILAAKETNHA